MKEMRVDQKVGARTYEKELDAKGKETGREVPPRFVGKVVEVSEDKKSGFVKLELTDAQKSQARLSSAQRGQRGPLNAIIQDVERKFFHADELEEVS